MFSILFIFLFFRYFLFRQFNAVGKQGGADGEFHDPSGVACSRDGLLYIADADNHRVQVLHAESGAFVRKVGTQGSGQGQFQYPQGVYLDDDNGLVYVADFSNSRVQVHRQDTLAFVRTIIVTEQGGQASRPLGVCCGAQGLLYVSDWKNRVVQVYERERGTHVKTIGAG